MSRTLQSLELKIGYGPGDDRLHQFYIPTLQASVRYERMTGFFTSHGLAVAAAGIAHLIAAGGQMRLLVGAQLLPEDVQAIEAGHDPDRVVAARLADALPDPAALEDQIARDRLAALAWMVARGSLQIQVVLPLDERGLPLPAARSQDYFHPKIGIFTDAAGDQVVFSGSINESVQAWERNYEYFMVFCSWMSDGRAYVAEAVGRFHRLWNQQEPGWMALSIPEAARQRLLRYAPASPPVSDPLERTPVLIQEPEPPALVVPAALRRQQVMARFLRDAPHLLDADDLAVATSVVAPWPHQEQTYHRIVATFPQRYLIADEVGLGKTIEAGLIVRQLYLSGLARRILILAPRSVLRQWQEELYEKFVLNVPRYEGNHFVDVFGREYTPQTANPWDDLPLALASSQLVKRRERQATLLAAQPWDLVVVDEAHHARRRDFLNRESDRPNRLLELLRQLQHRTDALLLLTATPMQVDPIEVWDLANLLGLAGLWGADGRHFLRYFSELQKPVEDADWAFVWRMVQAEVEAAGLDPAFVAKAQRELGVVEWEQVLALLHDRQPARAMRLLSPQARTVAAELARQHTPLRRLFFRNTRTLLRTYAKRGLLDATVPTREPRLVWVPMSEPERALYARIEEYVSAFYRKYEAERKGLGFIMTVYRRRLTSSFYAVRRSLERRLAYLQGQALGDESRAGFTDEDLEQDDLSSDIGDELEGQDRALFAGEIEYVQDFLHQLELFGDQDAKVQQLLNDLDEIFRTRDKVLIFTQYTDTMDFLRERLRRVYGRQVACYSGRGGELWDGVLWAPVAKEEIKNEFRRHDRIKILLCSEAASEGLNLQTCGVLINYDMPWNPMRVEQRIGRIDRIGQRYPKIWILNYFYEDTVEANVYRALEDRISWFQTVVGPLQPILARVGRSIETLVMLPGAERQAALAQELARLREDLEMARGGLDLDHWAATADGLPAASRTPSSPLTLPELAQALLTAPAAARWFRPHETLKEAWWLRCGELYGLAPEDRRLEEVAVTFDPACYDAHPNSVQLLSYGNPYLYALLDTLLAAPDGADEAGPADGPAARLLRLHCEQPVAQVAWYRLAGGMPVQVQGWQALQAALAEDMPGVEWTAAQMEQARADFAAAVERRTRALLEGRARLRAIRRSATVARARDLLRQAALVELALGQKPELFASAAYPLYFDEQAVRGLARHRYPFAPLLKLAGSDGLILSATDPDYLMLQGEPADRLHKRFADLRSQVERVLNELTKLQADMSAESAAPSIGQTWITL